MSREHPENSAPHAAERLSPARIQLLRFRAMEVREINMRNILASVRVTPDEIEALLDAYEATLSNEPSTSEESR